MPKIADYQSYLNWLFAKLDDYLINDLQTLIQIKQIKGAASYPLLHTILSGMELLGFILSGKIKNVAFTAYWNAYLCKQFPEYEGLDQIFRDVIRNGTAHYFLIKSGITVSRTGIRHLTIQQGCLNVDLVILHNHFIQTYNKIKSDLLENKLTQSTKTGCDKFNEQMDKANNKVQQIIANYPMGPSGADTASSDSMGYSGPTDTILPSGTEIPPHNQL